MVDKENGPRHKVLGLRENRKKSKGPSLSVNNFCPATVALKSPKNLYDSNDLEKLRDDKSPVG